MSYDPRHHPPPSPESNEYKIVPPNAFVGWLKEAILLLVDRPLFWLSYSTLFAIFFSLSSNIVYLHSIGILCFFVTVNLCRYFYTGIYKPLGNMSTQKHCAMVFGLLFFVIFLRYLFWLASAAGARFDTTGSGEPLFNLGISLDDYMNPITLLRSGLWREQFDLFIYNFAIAPYHYIQLSLIAVFFSMSVFVYPLFIWKKNSAYFSYRLGLKISLANAVPLSLTLILLIGLSFLVSIVPLAAFPYLYVFPSAVLYCAWADIFDEKKKKGAKMAIPEIEVVPNPIIAKMKSMFKIF